MINCSACRFFCIFVRCCCCCCNRGIYRVCSIDATNVFLPAGEDAFTPSVYGPDAKRNRRLCSVYGFLSTFVRHQISLNIQGLGLCQKIVRCPNKTCSGTNTRFLGTPDSSLSCHHFFCCRENLGSNATRNENRSDKNE